ncbi:unnamed protein product [Rhizoctonia solani]|uniref:DUF6535 domain-containing protein n=1 Tax=Rhizoctonia solani TaxID=456999 RepID=A0A8H3BYP8_9AGAM|nr:unnamed protein product [Rhizoctonia solani]CAE6469774.1 unnamed protein product [Rhizoctonia solani]
MSLLNPTYLSGGGKKPPKSSADPPPGPEMAHPPPDLTPSAPPVTQVPVNTDPTMERDEYGAEMGKEARVWKIYVKETDRADAELVDGWNKSLDVILVFAALFSAVSTAFLIESSQKLQEDPADVTAQTLLAISQALSVLINTTQPTGVQSSNTVNTGSFSPSRITVTVNTLWYLSLSLSVATSLLAMLAKDWCHSFLAGRTGHPHTQTMRRQQKWMMIEKWKMQELIMVLPSLIHLSLLLFAIGLCIYVWDLNTSVAWPVICVTVVSAGFYVWSSITASIIEYFPYTTVISRFLRSEWLFAVYGPPCIAAAHMMSNTLEWIHDSNVVGWFTSLDNWIHDRYRSLRDWADVVNGSLPVHMPKASPQDGYLDLDRVTTLALHWLITVCEAPSAIDAALQAIAGANAHIYHTPLESCNASLEISKRLVSGNIYKSADRHVVSLYIRALSFLGSKDSQATLIQANAHSLGDVQVAVWNLQTQYDEQVAQLIGDGKFEPTDQNIQALGIGTSIALHILQHLNGIKNDGTSLAESICQLLENHETLHPAALQSLMNALEWLPLIIVDCSVLLPVSAGYWVQLPYCETYLSKVFECVIEAGDHITLSTNEAVGEELMDLKGRLEDHNNYINREYRGLTSFTAFDGHHTVKHSPPQPHLAVDMTSGGELDTS